ncbi:MAG TPA: response regulator transcription factor [Solirubrobacterales bacterium]|nr:response regulator transcription factor [Solirubrobacterales bacterium]
MTQGPPIEALAASGWAEEAGSALAALPTAPAAAAPAPGPRVAVYHGRALARAGLVALLSERSFEVVAAAPPHSEATALAPSADVALVDASGHGANVAHRIGYETGTPVLMMVEEPPDGDVLLTVTAAGASGCVCHECPPERVVRGLRAVAAGGTFFECAHESTEPIVAVPALLSERERHVVEQLAGGAGTEEIAAALCISPHTARTHVRNIKRKLEARTCAQAVAMAITLRLVDPPARNSPAPPPGSPA